MPQTPLAGPVTAASAADRARCRGAAARHASRPVALLLPGQGSQYPRMTAGLYGTVAAFTEALDEVFDAMGREGARIRADWLAEQSELPMDHVLRAQPLLFAVDYALGRTVESWGVRPAALLGHSIGELAAATLAGVFSVHDAAHVVLDRVVRLAHSPPGGMIAVAASADQLAPFLDCEVVVAAVNAPLQTVLAGPEGALRAVGERLRVRGVAVRPVPALSPFHSPAIAPYAMGATAVLASVARHSPAVPIHSCATAAPLTAREIADPVYWAAQPVAKVRFWPALQGLLASGEFSLVEAGPGRGLSLLARQHPAVRRGDSGVLPLSPRRVRGPEDEVATLDAARQALRRELEPRA
ncbi:acyltransferase domain-containing protein [Streptomyces halobius]|uniref:Acyltransferase domain-containing protein n=1 Tax=Streptomyces halobius TaxID=2879846 RepID=A0ABY4M4B8_9ACTN|nr:acyltransferase domain-containing protein [Streptomyces halobius]UQA92607.1 acyltransferase domain-containing protein [Streptomyces halobius]